MEEPSLAHARRLLRRLPGGRLAAALAALAAPIAACAALTHRGPAADGSIRGAGGDVRPATESAPPPPAVREVSPDLVRVPPVRVDPERYRARKAQERRVWDRLADCESGLWDADADPIRGSARWRYGIHGKGPFEGGLQFHPQTWEEFRDADMPAHAGRASRGEQIAVAKRVLNAQGWEAWPNCSRRLGLR